jgi:hypothetical protein
MGIHLSFSSSLPVLVYEDDHSLLSHLTLNPVAGEKSCPALTLRGETIITLEEEAVSRSKKQMSFNPNSVPMEISDADRAKALAKVKEVDSKSVKGKEEDIINTGVSRGNFTLWHIRKRGGVKSKETGRKPVVAQQLLWMPHAVKSSMDEFVSYFARLYGQGDQAAGSVVFKERALQSEVIVQRSKMAPQVKAPGAKKGKFRS